MAREPTIESPTTSVPVRHRHITGGDWPVKGYELADFSDAFARFLKS